MRDPTPDEIRRVLVFFCANVRDGLGACPLCGHDEDVIDEWGNPVESRETFVRSLIRDDDEVKSG